MSLRDPYPGLLHCVSLILNTLFYFAFTDVYRFNCRTTPIFDRLGIPDTEHCHGDLQPVLPVHRTEALPARFLRRKQAGID